MADSLLHHGWPEPIVRVQSLSDSGAKTIPAWYVKPPAQRPSEADFSCGGDSMPANIPVIDMADFVLGGGRREEVLRQISDACRWRGFFQVVNHGVALETVRKVKEAWRVFFLQPAELKQAYANSPATYEGYGSRLGVEKGAALDWGDYFFLHLRPECLKKPEKWPTMPSDLKEVVGEYGREVAALGHRLMRIMAAGLGLPEEALLSAFGGDDDVGTCLRVNYYPKCPQPELTLGLSSHSDPGGLTMLLPDEKVAGLQVQRGSSWVTVKPVPDSFIVNVGDQIQVLSNGIYKSVEHRVIVSSMHERLSLALLQSKKRLANKPSPRAGERGPSSCTALSHDL